MSTWIGSIADRATQAWVRLTGRRVDPARETWLDGPIGSPRGIGARYFDDLALTEGLMLDETASSRGLLEQFDQLAGPGFDPGRVHPRVRHFYEHTSDYDMNVWVEWSGLFRPFGRLLAAIFSRRLQQLNLPLSALDPSQGLAARVLHLRDPASKSLKRVGWMRELRGGHVVYAGQYGSATPPALGRPAVQVVFPLPNGNAIVLLRPEVDAQGRLSLWSRGRRFGDAGFYFTVHHRDGRTWARYVKTMRELIVVYAGPDDDVRADHTLWVWGMPYLRIHYHLTLKRS